MHCRSFNGCRRGVFWQAAENLEQRIRNGLGHTSTFKKKHSWSRLQFLRNRIDFCAPNLIAKSLQDAPNVSSVSDYTASKTTSSFRTNVCLLRTLRKYAVQCNENAQKSNIYIKKRLQFSNFSELWLLSDVSRDLSIRKTGLRLTHCNKSTDSHSALCCLTTSNLFQGIFFFFKCNCAHVCALLGIINRLKVVVEAGEVHLYAAWDEPGSDEGKTALLPSRWPAGGSPHIFYGSLGIYINFSKASTFMSSAGTREGWANGAGGRIKCEIEMSEIIHFKSPETFIYCIDRITTFNYLKWLSIALIYLMNGSDLLT